MLPCFLVVVCCGSSFFVVDTELANSLCLSVEKGGGSDFSFHISPFRLHYPPSPPSGLSARRNGDCDPQRAQNDIKTLF